MVVPGLTYGCLIWGDSIIREIELLHIIFFKPALNEHRYTSTDVGNGELGVYPLDMIIKYRMINYCFRSIMGRNTKSSYIMYNCLLHLQTKGIYLPPWLECIGNIMY